MADARSSDEALREEDALKDLWNLHAEGIKPGLLRRCGGLAKEAASITRLLPEEELSKVLDALLRRIIRNELATKETPNGYLRAAGEFIGIRDKNMDDPPTKDYEVSRGRPATAFKMRIYRGGHRLGIDSYNSARHHIKDALEELLTAIRGFVATGDEVNKFVADFKQSFTKGGTAEAEPTSGDQHSVDNTEQEDVLPGYIHRPALEAQFKSLQRSGAKLIALVGLPGMGKSSLARALTRDAPFIEFEAGKPLLTHLIPALKYYGLGFQDLTEANAVMKLVDLLTVEAGPQFLVLDNLQSTSELRRLVPRTTTTIVVATCRESGYGAPDHRVEVAVGAMRPDESLRLIRMKLPLLDEADAAFSAQALGHYPLVISVACGTAGAAGISMRELCSSLQLEPGDIRTEGGEKLRGILEYTLTLLRECNPMAVELLAFLVSSKRPYANLRNKGLLALTCELYGFDVGPHRYADALRELRRFFLVEIAHSYGVDFDVKVHPLLRSIFSSLLEDEVARIDATALRCVRRLINIRLDTVPPGHDHPELDKRIFAFAGVLNAHIPEEDGAFIGAKYLGNAYRQADTDIGSG